MAGKGAGKDGARHFLYACLGCVSVARLPGVVRVGAAGFLGLSCQSVNTDGWGLVGTGRKRRKCAGSLVARAVSTWCKPFCNKQTANHESTDSYHEGWVRCMLSFQIMLLKALITVLVFKPKQELKMATYEGVNPGVLMGPQSTYSPFSTGILGTGREGFKSWP